MTDMTNYADIAGLLHDAKSRNADSNNAHKRHDDGFSGFGEFLVRSRWYPIHHAWIHHRRHTFSSGLEDKEIL